MEQKELIYLIIFISIFVLIFISALVLFIFQYRKKKLENIQETQRLQHLYQQQLLQTQLEIQQQTMQQIGQEIHDNVGQKLTLASLYIQQLDLDNNTETTTKTNSIKSIIDESLQELRNLSKSLTSNDLAAQSIKMLLLQEIEKLNDSGKFFIKSTIADIPINNIIIKTILLRITQEFFQNTIKHAKAKSIDIQLVQNDNELLLTLLDDGIGFTTLTNHQGIGLQNIHKRAALIGANCTFESQPNKGVLLQLTLPNHKLI